MLVNRSVLRRHATQTLLNYQKMPLTKLSLLWKGIVLSWEVCLENIKYFVGSREEILSWLGWETQTLGRRVPRFMQ